MALGLQSSHVSSEQLVKRLRHQFETFGASEELASDGGLGYVAATTQTFLKQWGCRHRLSSAYFPHSNLRAEQGVKMAKKLIRDNTALVADQVYIHPKYREL